MKAKTMRVGGEIVRPKMFPFRSTTVGVTPYDVIRTSRLSNGGHLGFLDFPETSGKRRN